MRHYRAVVEDTMSQSQPDQDETAAENDPYSDEKGDQLLETDGSGVSLRDDGHLTVTVDGTRYVYVPAYIGLESGEDGFRRVSDYNDVEFDHSEAWNDREQTAVSRGCILATGVLSLMEGGDHLYTAYWVRDTLGESRPDRDATAERVDPDFVAVKVPVTTNGRVRIPARLRDAYDIEAGDVLHVTIRTDETACTVMDGVVNQRGGFRVPKHKRDLYDLTHGKRVRLEVEVTDRKHEDSE